MRVCNSACSHHQLVNCPPVCSAGNESDSIPDKRDGFTGRQQPIGRARDSPLPAWAPPDRCTPSLPSLPPLSSLPPVFSNLHAGQNTSLLLHAKLGPETLRTPVRSRQTARPSERATQRTRRQNLAVANAPACVLAGGNLPVDLSMTSLFGLLQSAPSFSPLETASDLQQ